MYSVFVAISILSFSMSYSQVKKGQAAPIFNLRNTNGELVKPFQDIKKPIILSFFFTECVNCKKEIKELYELYSKYNSVFDVYLVGTSFKKDVNIVSDIKDFINEIGVDFVPLVDRYLEVINKYKIIKYPTIIIIDKNGNISYIFDNFNDSTFNEIEKIVKKYR